MKHWLAKELINIHAVSLSPNEPYIWSSGIKSPIYCDNRLTLSYPALRQSIAEGLIAIIHKYYPEVDVIAGTATAGIPHAALVADRMGLPMIYVRGKSKSHGKGNQVEGTLKANQKVVIIEDLISTGGSVITVQKAIEEAGANVLGSAAIFTYGLQKGKDLLLEAGLRYETLTDYNALLEAALENKYVTSEEMTRLQQWQKNPENDSWLSLPVNE